MLLHGFNVPEAFALAVPTDGLGISNSDEDQFGFTYLELDIYIAATDAGIEMKDSSLTTKIRRAIAARSFKRDNPRHINPLKGRRPEETDRIAQFHDKHDSERAERLP